MKDSIVSYDLEMALEHIRRAYVQFAEADEPYYCEWLTHCKNELQNCYDSFLKEFFPENKYKIFKETKKDVKEYYRKT